MRSFEFAGALALAFAGACAAARAQDTRLRLARVELSGPLRRVELVQRANERTLLAGELAPGESAVFTLPVPVLANSLAVEPRIAWDVTGDERRGRARFVGWSNDPTAFARASIGLRSRPKPPVSAGTLRAGGACVLVLVASWCVAQSLRKRVLALVGVALVGACAAALLVAREPGEVAARVEVLDGARDADPWVEIVSGAERLELASSTFDSPFQVQTEPREAELEVHADLRRPERVVLVARGARIHVSRLVAPPAGGFSQELGPPEALDATWARREGVWSFAGASWPGQALASDATDSAGASRSPPGWVVAGLPQGVDVLVGRTRARADPLAGAPRGERWLRVSGW